MQAPDGSQIAAARKGPQPRLVDDHRAQRIRYRALAIVARQTGWDDAIARSIAHRATADRTAASELEAGNCRRRTRASRREIATQAHAAGRRARGRREAAGQFGQVGRVPFPLSPVRAVGSRPDREHDRDGRVAAAVKRGGPGPVALHSALITLSFTSTFLQVATLWSVYLNPFEPIGLLSAVQFALGRRMVSLATPSVNVKAAPSLTGLSVLGSGSANVPLHTSLVLPPDLFRYTRTGIGTSAAYTAAAANGAQSPMQHPRSNSHRASNRNKGLDSRTR